jgi:hypothetical protein
LRKRDAFVLQDAVCNCCEFDGSEDIAVGWVRVAGKPYFSCPAVERVVDCDEKGVLDSGV